MKPEFYDLQRMLIRAEIAKQLEGGQEFSDDQIREMIDESLSARACSGKLSVALRRRMAEEIFDSIRGLDVLQRILEDEEVTEIMVNGPDRIFVEKHGTLFRWGGQFESMEKLQDVIQQIAAGCNRVVNEASPILDARLEDGSRVNVVLAPVALNGPAVTIRRFPTEGMTLDKLVQLGALSEECAAFLRRLVKSRYNIFISGGTGSGKTTFLNALSQAISESERIITIEDSAELQLAGIENLISLETRNQNVEGCRPVTIRDLIRTSLRMRPSRIIVGEIRGAEISELLTAYNSGHAGSMSTGHANSAQDMLLRMETMLLMALGEMPLEAIRRQIASGIDILIHLGRMRDGNRKVLEIREILGFADGEILTQPLYVFEENTESTREKVCGSLVRKGELIHEEKLAAAGMV
ncbi:MAG: CpaF family protein [Lachnospiraceae bacterium]|nr:CpaF family protein [Lachnospiraceae bacterium]